MVNYHKMIEYKSYARVYMITFQVSILTTTLCILIGYPLAYFLSQLPKRIAGILMLTVLLPFWTSLLVRTYAWLVLLQKKGLLNDFAIHIGLWDSPIKLVHNLTGTLIGMAHIMLPFLILPLYGAMRRIDPEMMHAAANLGAKPLEDFLPNVTAWNDCRIFNSVCFMSWILCYSSSSWRWQSSYGCYSNNRHIGKSIQLGSS